VVAKVRTGVGGKVGHAGTLDPMATGLLVLGVGRSTRLLRFVQGLQKEYEASAQFGVATDSLDADGSILERTPMDVSATDVVAAMSRFTGRIMQIPPMVSARKVEGRRLYEIAREGGEVEREARPVTISELDLVDFAPGEYPEIVFRVVCSTGTYVRTLADDLARSVGGRAHLTALRRTRIGSLTVGDAVTVDEATADPGGHLVAPAAALADLPVFTASGELAQAVRHGVALPGPVIGAAARTDDVLAVVDDAGSLLAVYRFDGKSARAEVVVG